jgi:hypothetical protein
MTLPISAPIAAPAATAEAQAAPQRPDVREQLEELKLNLEDSFDKSATPKDAAYLHDYPVVAEAVRGVTTALGIPYTEETATFSVSVTDKNGEFGVYVNTPIMVSSNGKPAIFWGKEIVEIDPATPLASETFRYMAQGESAHYAYFDPKGYCWPFKMLMLPDAKPDMMRASTFGDVVPYLRDFTRTQALRELSPGTDILITARAEKTSAKGSQYFVVHCESGGNSFLAYDPFKPEEWESIPLPVNTRIGVEAKTLLVGLAAGTIELPMKAGGGFTELKELQAGATYDVVKIELVPGNPNGAEAWMKLPKHQATIVHPDKGEVRVDCKGKKFEHRFGQLPSLGVVTPEAPGKLEIRGKSGTDKVRVTWRFNHSTLKSETSALDRLAAANDATAQATAPAIPIPMAATPAPAMPAAPTIPAPMAAPVPAPAPAAIPAPAPMAAPAAAAMPIAMPVAAPAPMAPAPASAPGPVELVV